jgi:gliding motility-associated-like protein
VNRVVRYFFYSLVGFTLITNQEVNGQNTLCGKFLYQKDTVICPGSSVLLNLVPAPAPDTVLPGVWKQLIAQNAIDSVLFNIKPFGYDRANQFLYSIIHQQIIRYDLKNNSVSSINATNWPGDFTEFTFDYTNNRLIYWRGGRDSVYALPAAGGSWTLIGSGAIDRESFGSSSYWNPTSQQPGFYGGFGFNQMKSWIFESSVGGWNQKKSNPLIDSVPPKGGNLIASNSNGTKLYLFAGQGSYSGNELDGTCVLGSPWASQSGMYCWLKDLWELDLSTYSFKNILPVNNASIKYQGAVGYDYDKSRFFLFGGYQPTDNYLQNQSLTNTNKTFRFRTTIDAGFVEFNGQGDAPPAVVGTNSNGVTYYDPVGKRMIWARYDGIWAYYPDSTSIPLTQKSYLWSTGDTTEFITVNPTITTPYKITRTSGGFVCTDSILITVQSMQTTLLQTVNVCGDTAHLDAGVGFNSYLWSTGETTQNITANKNGIYTVSLTKGLCTSKDSSTVQLASSVFDFIVKAQKDSVCYADSDTLNVVSPQNGVVYSWYLPGSFIKINSGIFYGLSSVTKNASYVISGNSVPAVCPSKSATVAITVRPQIAKPTLKIDSLGANTIVVSWNAIPDASAYLLSLDNGVSYQYPTDGILALKEVVNGIAAGQSQKVIIKALGTVACQTSDTSQIVATTINPFGNGLYVPNAFTPNGDGSNDLFRVYGTAISSIRLKVYSQWGDLVFSSTDVVNGWDGNYKGNKSPASVYTYTLEAKMQDGTDIIKKGSFTLIR